MTIEQRLAEIEGDIPEWLEDGDSFWVSDGWEYYRKMDVGDARWLLSLVRSMQAVVEAAEGAADLLGGGWGFESLQNARADAASKLRAALQAYRRESEGK